MLLLFGIAEAPPVPVAVYETVMIVANGSVRMVRRLAA
jgi:hypothetical protein